MSNNEYDHDNSANISFGNSSQGMEIKPADTVKHISTAEFVSEVIEESKNRPVLVDFWAPWCGPCKQLAPELEKAVAATRGKVKLVKMDIDKHPEIPGQMGIQSIPAVVAFVDGRPADMFMGTKPESEIREFITKVTGPSQEETQIEAALRQAAQLSEQGAVGDASAIYGQILAADPGNVKATAALGHLYVHENNLDGAKSLLAGLNEEATRSVEVQSLLSAIDLAEQASGLGDTEELIAAVEANKNDHQARLDLALAYNASGKREEAADALLEIIRRQPGWNEDAAKNQLLQLFEAWGLTDAVTVSARRKLSSLLFS